MSGLNVTDVLDQIWAAYDNEYAFSYINLMVIKTPINRKTLLKLLLHTGEKMSH